MRIDESTQNLLKGSRIFKLLVLGFLFIQNISFLNSSETKKSTYNETDNDQIYNLISQNSLGESSYAGSINQHELNTQPYEYDKVMRNHEETKTLIEMNPTKEIKCINSYGIANENIQHNTGNPASINICYLSQPLKPIIVTSSEDEIGAEEEENEQTEESEDSTDGGDDDDDKQSEEEDEDEEDEDEEDEDEEDEDEEEEDEDEEDEDEEDEDEEDEDEDDEDEEEDEEDEDDDEDKDEDSDNDDDEDRTGEDHGADKRTDEDEREYDGKRKNETEDSMNDYDTFSIPLKKRRYVRNDSETLLESSITSDDSSDFPHIERSKSLDSTCKNFKLRDLQNIIKTIWIQNISELQYLSINQHTYFTRLLNKIVEANLPTCITLDNSIDPAKSLYIFFNKEKLYFCATDKCQSILGLMGTLEFTQTFLSQVMILYYKDFSFKVKDLIASIFKKEKTFNDILKEKNHYDYFMFRCKMSFEQLGITDPVNQMSLTLKILKYIYFIMDDNDMCQDYKKFQEYTVNLHYYYEHYVFEFEDYITYILELDDIIIHSEDLNGTVNSKMDEFVSHTNQMLSYMNQVFSELRDLLLIKLPNEDHFIFYFFYVWGGTVLQSLIIKENSPSDLSLTIEPFYEIIRACKQLSRKNVEVLAESLNQNLVQNLKMNHNLMCLFFLYAQLNIFLTIFAYLKKNMKHFLNVQYYYLRSTFVPEKESLKKRMHIISGQIKRVLNQGMHFINLIKSNRSYVEGLNEIFKFKELLKEKLEKLNEHLSSNEFSSNIGKREECYNTYLQLIQTFKNLKEKIKRQ